MSEGKKLFIIDGSSYIFRAFFGVPNLSNSKGFPTNAVFGFLKMLKNTLSVYKPTHIVIALDSKEETFRKKMFPEYKANREAMPDELKVQVPHIEELINAMNIPSIRVNGVEADDIIATYTKLAEKHGFTVDIISGDKDLMQLVNDKTIMIDTLKNKTYNIDGVVEKLGVEPKHVIDYLSIIGDTSDNIPGVRGIGPKGAVKLISEYGTLENIYEKIDSIKNKKHQEYLTKSKENAFLSKELIKLKYDVPLHFSVHDFDVKEPDREKLLKIFKEMEFISEIREWGLLADKKTEIPSTEEPLPREQNFDLPAKGGLRIIDNEAVEYEGALLGHDLLRKFDFKTLSKYEKLFDTKLAAYVLSPGERDYNIEDISIRTTGGTFSTKKLPEIMQKLDAEIKHNKLERAYYDIDLPCIKPLKEIGETGALVDKNKLEKLSVEFGSLMDECTKKIYKEAGTEFNINSPKQLSYILFEKMGIPATKKIASGFSTDQDVLLELASSFDFPKLIIEYREIAKLKSTYVEPLLEEAKKGDGRIRTTYNLDVTATGRLSSTDPNLQNIPIRTTSGAKIREVFIAPKGKRLISADYSQIELRILAHLGQDKIMIKSFNDGEDIHIRTASEIFDVPIELVTMTQRREAKAVNFGIMYGKTPFGLARELGIPNSTAATIIKRYFERYKDVAAIRDELIKSARQKGYTETMFGRRRYLPEINSRKPALRNFAERNAVNAPIQGTASDIIKMATVKVWEMLRTKFPQAKIILNVHDELVVEAPEGPCSNIAAAVKKEMESVFSLNPPLAVDVNIGQTWLEAH